MFVEEIDLTKEFHEFPSEIMDPTYKKKFMDQVLDVPCPCVCPYQIILQYMNSIPDPYGQIAESSHKPSLHFMRSKVKTGTRRFLKGPLGNMCCSNTF